MFTHNNTLKHYDVLISGRGPTGMAAAYSALRSGKSVCIVTLNKPNEFTRDQLVFLSRKARGYLIEMVVPHFGRQGRISDVDKLFINNLDTRRYISFNGIERFLFRRIDRYSTLTVMYENSLSEVDMNTGVAVIGRGDAQVSITFDILIGADGARHHACDLVNQSRRLISYSNDFKSVSKYHVGIRKAKISLGEKSVRDDEITKIRVKDGLYYIVIINFTSGSDTATCDVAGEIPKKLYFDYLQAKAEYMSSGEEEAFLAATNTIQVLLVSRIHLTLENNRSAVSLVCEDGSSVPTLTVFKTDLKQASRAVVASPQPVGKKKLFILCGDAFRPGYYPFGEGVNNGFKHVLAMQNIFDASPDTLKPAMENYERRCLQLANKSKLAIWGVSLVRGYFFSHYGASNVQVEFNEHRSLRVNPVVHRMASVGNVRGLEKVARSNKNDLTTVNMYERNILHVAAISGKSKVFVWLARNYPSIFLTLIFRECPCIANTNETFSPMRLLMYCDSLSHEEKDDFFKMIMEILNKFDVLGRVMHPSLDNFAHIAARNNLDKSFEYLIEKNESMFYTLNSVNYSPLKIILCKANFCLEEILQWPEKTILRKLSMADVALLDIIKNLSMQLKNLYSLLMRLDRSPTLLLVMRNAIDHQSETPYESLVFKLNMAFELLMQKPKCGEVSGLLDNCMAQFVVNFQVFYDHADRNNRARRLA